MAQILIVDDDAQLRQSFGKILEGEGFEVRAAPSGEAGVDEVAANPPDLVVMDVRMPGMTGIEAMQHMRASCPGLPVIIMTAYGGTETAIEATKLGAFDYILKPFDIPDILRLIGQALNAGRLARARVAIGPDEDGDDAKDDALVGQSRAMQEVFKAIGRAAPTDALVLVRGESGTGKELVARALWQHSARADKPFVVINCVAIPETLLESELFGYEKGAFTGAGSRRVGKIEQAQRGTVFLDEIGDMPMNVQAKMLRLLQEKQIERLGGRETIPVDVRIIAATNRDLEAAVAEGRLREDLYYRLKVVSVMLPPLRERTGDVPRLAAHFLSRLSREMDMPNPGLTPEALDVLSAHSWPGNVRELGNAVQKALIFSRGCPIGQEEMLQAIGSGAAAVAPERGDDPLRAFIRRALMDRAGENAFEHVLDAVGRSAIAEALELTGGNRTRAAKLLGLSRPTLIAKIEKYGLKVVTQVRR
ncbi:two-component system, NtrC family, nitrogen regulation response regulator GlnG [Humidesulfovibrio mexicanus]|uniref:DNA-binding transcriptional regulator NtrC n=1 Tax=Humidesulfovibrio mexicanus TaxID=147047 RepID=A0A238ZVT8_9BACT|nr:sigma-54 dependent transcriptional regulator [Humidesulfovibrio mexicanus]SNR87111.1 two-component system, NtrC family, nitrogen regulation response regulator GlnG [Humidesulfovibrio mexicanus]